MEDELIGDRTRLESDGSLNGLGDRDLRPPPNEDSM
jgi:hypothetical protein